MTLTSCGPRDGRFNPSNFNLSGAAAPPEVVLPQGVKPGDTVYGIKTTKPGYEGICCAAQARVDLPVRKEGPASGLHIGIFTPHGHSQRLTVRFPDGTVESRVPARTGMDVLKFPVPRALRARRGIVPVRIDAEQAPYVLISIYFV